MATYLPRFYETSKVMKSLLQAEGTEFDNLRQAMNEVLEQFFVNTATWGLDIWEQELGIRSSVGKPADQRRAVIKSNIRGIGTVTINLVKNVAESYDGGTVEVIDQPALYQFTVKFVDTRGIPPNLDDLKAAIEAIKPAHLAVKYEFRYLIWDELDAKNLTWDQLDNKNVTWNEFETGGWLNA
ncbi:YmfQ family protein [Desulforamulus aeronauticus]|uniref:YmfQ family protein n=1 Tax=Desulforamulus aeronauticus TaxID=53343 RepID=UPI000AA03F77|nr:YmfQ family protein [Desulforamulus aeronauticus]